MNPEQLITEDEKIVEILSQCDALGRYVEQKQSVAGRWQEATVLFVVLALMACFGTEVALRSKSIAVFLVSCGLLMVATTFVLRQRWRYLLRHKRHLIQELIRVDDVRAIPRFMMALQWMSKAEMGAAFLSLMRLIPQLKQEDSYLFSVDQKIKFYASVLKENVDFPLTDNEKFFYRLAGIKAMEQIGDEGAIHFLVSIAYDYSEDEKLRREAEVALQSVKQRLNDTKESQTLLRASDNTAADATLLKPAMPQDAEQDNLLRPVV
jgi:hypothetical protein